MAKTAQGLIEYAKAQLGLPYWYGTYGQTATAELYEYKRSQWATYYKSWSDFPKQYGKRVHDCVGLIKGYLWSDTPTSTPKYNATQDVSANGMRSRCTEKGDIKTIPDMAGVLVFMDGHVGVYIGGGYVIEAAGHENGVIKTELKKRPWKWWGKCPWIDYSDKPQEAAPSAVKNDIPVKKARIKSGTWNVRKLPDLKAEIVTVVKGGRDIKVLDGWQYVPELGGFISDKVIE